MSTQSSSFSPIHFSITTAQQNFRLLELPPELLELLTSDDRPDTLDLKSAAPTSTGATKSSAEYLHLCTNTKSWAVRQVSTSNSVYVTTPSAITATTDPTSASSTTTKGITAVSKPTSHLELLPTTPSPAEIKAAVLRLLPTQDSTNSAPDPSSVRWPNPTPPPLTQEDLLANLPYPTHLITPILRSQLVFSDTRTGSLSIPSPALLLESWRLFVEAATETAIPLDDPRRPAASFNEIIDALPLDEGSSGPAGQVHHAVLRAITHHFTDAQTHQDVVGRKAGVEASEGDGQTVSGPLNVETLTVFVGGLLVQCTPSQAIAKERLQNEWISLVPTSWEKYCDIAKLGDDYRTDVGSDGAETVRYASAISESALSTQASAESPAAAATGKRKWHERFAAQRNQK